MPKPKVFISHIHAEADLARMINDKLIEPHLLGTPDVFVSSDPSTNPSGTSWLSNIEDALVDATVLLIIASPRSVSKPWINIEAGAAWLRSLQARKNSNFPPVYVMPLCHSGLTPGRLPLPWSTFNAVELRTAGGLQQVLETIARAADIRAPHPDLNPLVDEIMALEQRYMVYDEVERQIGELVTALGPQYLDVFKKAPPPGQFWGIPLVRISTIAAIDATLLALKQANHIDVQLGSLVAHGGGPHGAYQAQDVRIRPTDQFLNNILPHLKL